MKDKSEREAIINRGTIIKLSEIQKRGIIGKIFGWTSNTAITSQSIKITNDM